LAEVTKVVKVLTIVGGVMRVCLPIKGPDFHCFGAFVHPLTFSTHVLLFKEILETLQ
jgi:hypothetical protein